VKFKHDLEMWHMFKEFAEELKQVSNFNEIRLIKLCKYYEWDSDASEEYCRSDRMQGKDLDSRNMCWKCPYYLSSPPKEAEKPS